MPPNECLQLARKRVARNLRVHFQTDTLSLVLEERLGVFKTQRTRELSVVAQDRMDVERKVGAVEGQVVLQSPFQHPSPAARDRLQSRPEQAVVDNEKIDPALDRRIDRPRGGINRGANPGDGAGISDLQPIESIGPIFDLPDAKEIATIIHQLVHGCHRVSSTQRAAD